MSESPTSPAEHISFAEARRLRRNREVAEWRPDRGEDNSVLIGTSERGLKRLRAWLEAEQARAAAD